MMKFIFAKNERVILLFVRIMGFYFRILQFCDMLWWRRAARANGIWYIIMSGL